MPKSRCLFSQPERKNQTSWTVWIINKFFICYKMVQSYAPSSRTQTSCLKSGLVGISDIYRNSENGKCQNLGTWSPDFGLKITQPRDSLRLAQIYMQFKTIYTKNWSRLVKMSEIRTTTMWENYVCKVKVYYLTNTLLYSKCKKSGQAKTFFKYSM